MVETLSRARWVGVATVVLGELRYGFLTSRKTTENEAQLGRFLAHPIVEVLPVDNEISQIYAEIFTTLRHAGTPVPTNDVWIAAVATRHGAAVLTYDAHFQRIARVTAKVLAT